MGMAYTLHKMLARKIFSALLLPLDKVPNSTVRNHVKAGLFQLAGAPRKHVPISVPRRKLLIHPGDTAVLIGAVNESLLSRYAEAVGSRGHVLIFEPSPQAYNKLLSASNSYSYVQIDPRAVWPEPGRITLSSDPDYPGGGRVRSSTVDEELPSLNDPNNIDAEAETLDTLLAEYGVEPDFVETMVNGTEYDVLKSGEKTLEESSPRILCKAYGYGEEAPKRVKRLISFLHSKEYSISLAPIRSPHVEPYKPDGDIFAWKNL